MFVMNNEDGGFDCPGCAWPDDPSGLHLDVCESGVKHVTWELVRKQAAGRYSVQNVTACQVSPPFSVSSSCPSMSP
jgi:hypothetical protein